MKIEKYISALLYRYQCVTVPGFGAFLTEWQSAQVIEGQHSFIPPNPGTVTHWYLYNKADMYFSIFIKAKLTNQSRNQNFINNFY
jgi:hypothetical protein